MLRDFILIFCLYFAGVYGVEQKLLSLDDENIICGPVVCPINLTAMCFYTSRLTKDSQNGTYITSCGTCLATNGTTVRESCSTEPTTITNYTNTMSISLVNSQVDSTRFRNGITGLLMSEMANSAGPSPYPSVSFNPPYPMPTPQPQGSQGPQGPPYPMPMPQPQPVIVVQPPAQQIYFNPPPWSSDQSYSFDTSRPPRSPNEYCTPPNSPECIRSTQNFQPNGLPPQLDKVYNDIRTMHRTLDSVQATIRDMAAGLPIGYLDTSNSKYPSKQSFPVFTPPGPPGFLK